MPLSPGQKLGAYEIVAPLGAGGMGEVYKARYTRLGRDVAIKILPQHLSSDPPLHRLLADSFLLAPGHGTGSSRSSRNQ
jgi:serine/threonine protein kinase